MSAKVVALSDHGSVPRGRAVGLGEGVVMESAQVTLVTYALGSCLGLTLWDPLARVGGMLHSQLPVSIMDPERAASEPFLFTDTGVTEMLRRMYALGADRKRVIAKIAGCAQSVSADSSFRVGKRNLAVARRVLWKNDIMIKAEDVGDSRPRTMLLDMDTGVTVVRSNGDALVL